MSSVEESHAAALRCVVLTWAAGARQRTWLIHWSLFVYFKPELASYPNFRSEV